MKVMKLKIKFAKEIRFDVPTRQIFRTWGQLLSGTRLSERLPARAERPRPRRRGSDYKLSASLWSISNFFRSADILVPGFLGCGTGDWKVARTRRLESLRYIIPVTL